MTDDKEYKLISMQAENVMRLKAVDITFKDGVNTIAGRNGAGKSSTLNSILFALNGGKSIPDQPIRKGAEKGSITIDLNEFVVKRTFTAKATYLTVETKDGAKYGKPQDMLDGLMSRVSLDPLEFMRQKPKDQYDTIRKIADIEVDIDELEALNKADFEKRTDIKRDAKSVETQAEGIIIPADTPEEPVIIADLISESNRYKDASNELAMIDERVKNADTTISNNDSDIKSVEDEIENLTAKLDKLKADAERFKSAREEIITKQQEAKLAIESMRALEVISKEIQDAESINANVASQKRKEELEAKAADLRKEEEALDDAIDTRKATILQAIADADMPIEGLSFSEGQVLFNGIPLDQASSAEQIKISTAIAMSMNPKLNLIFIRDGSLLDDDSLNAIKDMAQEYRYQVIIESVRSDDPLAIWIEDGEVVEKSEAA